jgi:hypothetical protein
LKSIELSAIANANASIGIGMPDRSGAEGHGSGMF